MEEKSIFQSQREDNKNLERKNGVGQFAGLPHFFYLELYCYPKHLFTHKEVRVTMISCPRRDLNPHIQRISDFESDASASSATRAFDYVILS